MKKKIKINSGNELEFVEVLDIERLQPLKSKARQVYL